MHTNLAVAVDTSASVGPVIPLQSSTMSRGLDMSLDDLIKQSKSRPKASPTSSSGPTRRAPPAARSAPYRPTASKATAAAPLYGVYSEHVAAMEASAPSPLAAALRALEMGTKLHICNLDVSVTVEDVQELFSEVGELKRYSVNYDKDGRSKGTAEVVFARKVDALDAIRRYNGVLLDGKPMKIELIGNNAEPPPTAPLMYDRSFPNYNAIPNSVPQRGGPRGPFHGNGRPGSSGQGSGGPRGIFHGNGRPGSSGGQGRGKARGHVQNHVQKSAADLDAELDQYHAEAVKQK